MRTHSAQDDAILRTRGYKTHYELWLDESPIGRLAGDDAYNPFVSGSIEAQVGQPVQSATFSCHLGKGTKSLSPFLSTGIKNVAGTGPACYPGRFVRLRTATTPAGESPAGYWRSVFHGRIDSFDMSPTGSDADLITIKARDIFGETQDRWIHRLSVTDQGTIYGFPVDAARVDIAMQQVADLAYGFPASPGLTIVVEGIPALAVGAYWQEQMGLLEALRRLGTTTTGWDLRGRWDVRFQDQFDLTYYNPDRAKNQSNITTLGKDAGLPYHNLRLSSSLANVRNRCDVIPANDLRVPQRTEDAASIAEFGIRWAGLSEDKSSGIETDPEALALAGIMVSDMSQPPVDLTLDMPYYWLFEVNDLFQVLPDNFSYDGNHIFAVSNIVHTFAEGAEASTSIGGSLAARAAIREWTEGRKRRNQVRLGEPSGPGFEGDIWLQTDDLTLPTVL
jgi:hypothetical protein